MSVQDVASLTVSFALASQGCCSLVHPRYFHIDIDAQLNINVDSTINIGLNLVQSRCVRRMGYWGRRQEAERRAIGRERVEGRGKVRNGWMCLTRSKKTDGLRVTRMLQSPSRSTTSTAPFSPLSPGWLSTPSLGRASNLAVAPCRNPEQTHVLWRPSDDPPSIPTTCAIVGLIAAAPSLEITHFKYPQYSFLNSLIGTSNNCLIKSPIYSYITSQLM